MLIPGNLYILTAPSGAGKTTLAQKLATSMDNIQLSISYTTRPARSGEISGKDYYFVDEAQFNAMKKTGAFLEDAKVHNHYYGTSRLRIEEQLKAGADVILAIDWQGAAQIRSVFKEAISIFILPPCKSALRQRLQSRGQDDKAVIENRLSAAKGEIAHYVEFDYVVVNDILENASQDIQAIIHANRLLSPKQAIRQRELLAEWLDDA